MKQITPAFCFGLRWQWRQFMALFKNGTGVPLKNNEKHLGNRGSLAQHLSCRAFPAFPDLSVRLWVAKRTRLSPPGPHWSCTAASQPERQNARMPYSTYTLSLYINTLIIYPIYIYIYISCIYISYIYILYILYITYVKCVTNGYVMCTNKNAKYIYIYLPTFAIKLPQVLGLFPTHRTLDTHGAFGPT